MSVSSWFLIGPTASGKNRVGVALARQLGAEVISLDSIKIFRRMDIGTAKPPLAARGGVPHHLIDLVEPPEHFDVARYMAEIDRVLAALDQRGVPALFVGGTLLHLQALLRGLFDGPPADPALREKLLREASTQPLHERLSRVDPQSAARLHPNDAKRLVRALEVYELTGSPLSELQQARTRPHLARPYRGIILSRAREQLYARIDQRCVEMFDAGWVDEVREIRDSCGFGLESREAIGYRAILTALAEGLEPESCLPAIQHSTHRLSRKQATWIRKFQGQMGELAVQPSWEADRVCEQACKLAEWLAQQPATELEPGKWLKGTSEAP